MGMKYYSSCMVLHPSPSKGWWFLQKTQEHPPVLVQLIFIPVASHIPAHVQLFGAIRHCEIPLARRGNRWF